MKELSSLKLGAMEWRLPTLKSPSSDSDSSPSRSSSSSAVGSEN